MPASQVADGTTSHLLKFTLKLSIITKVTLSAVLLIIIGPGLKENLLCGGLPFAIQDALQLAKP